jgi:uncharacterized membrane protein (UPF0136 family)
MEARQVETTHFPIIGAALIAIAAILRFIHELKAPIPIIAAALGALGAIVILVHQFMVVGKP